MSPTNRATIFMACKLGLLSGGLILNGRGSAWRQKKVVRGILPHSSASEAPRRKKREFTRTGSGLRPFEMGAAPKSRRSKEEIHAISLLFSIVSFPMVPNTRASEEDRPTVASCSGQDRSRAPLQTAT